MTTFTVKIHKTWWPRYSTGKGTVKPLSYLEILRNISLKPYHTFGLDVRAASFVEIHSREDLFDLIRAGALQDKHLFLGGGSNVLFTGDYDGLIIRNCLKGIRVIHEDLDTVLLEAAGGEVWHDLVTYTVTRGWGGIENLSLIPGTVGAAPMQNIGAYGVELTRVFYKLTAIELASGEEHTFDHQACRFGYRESVFKHDLKGKYFISAVQLRLQKHPELHISYGAIREVLAERHIEHPGVQDVSDAVISIRKSKLPDPAILGNAGSFFKNPEIDTAQYLQLKAKYAEMPGYPTQPDRTKVPAGWLIEQCGWKGKRVGNTGAHKDQALVLVNYGNATGQEIMQLAFDIQKSVMEKFNIEILPEVNLV